MSERSDSPEKSGDINIPEKSIEALIFRLMPTPQYFEVRFNNLEQKFDYKFEVMNGKVDQLARSQESLKLDMDQRFVRVDEQFKGVRSDMDQRFARVDEQFSEVRSDMDQRFARVDEQFSEVRSDMDQRFKEFRLDIDKRFEQVDKRFEQVDKRFEQVDQRFEQVDAKLDKIIDKIDRRIEDGLRENRSQSFRLFSFAMTFSAISMIGMLGRLFNLF